MSSQMEVFGKAIKDYANGRYPEMYPGERTKALALELARTIPLDAPAWFWGKAGGCRVVHIQKGDLASFGVEFDTWFRESWLHGQSPIDHAFSVGRLWETGVSGPICGNCAHPMRWGEDGRWCYPCSFCSPIQPTDEEWLAYRDNT